MLFDASRLEFVMPPWRIQRGLPERCACRLEPEFIVEFDVSSEQAWEALRRHIDQREASGS